MKGRNGSPTFSGGRIGLRFFIFLRVRSTSPRKWKNSVYFYTLRQTATLNDFNRIEHTYIVKKEEIEENDDIPLFSAHFHARWHFAKLPLRYYVIGAIQTAFTSDIDICL